MSLFGRKAPKEPVDEPPCDHVHYDILVTNMAGYGRCRDCGREINAAILLDGTAQRLIALEKRVNALLLTRGDS
jgi:hypothetical protein